MLLDDKALDGTPVSKLKPGSCRRVSQQCDICGAKTETTYANYYRAQHKRDFDGKTFCRACQGSKTIKAVVAEYGPWNKGKRLLDRSGEASPSWKGGRFISHDGYVMVHQRQANDKSRGWGSYRKEHVVVMEQLLGRSLEPDEVVHHIDGNRQNNAPENLWLSRNADHTRLHNSIKSLLYDLYRVGLLTFSREAGSYMAHDKLRELLEHPEEDNQQPSTPGMG